MPYAAWRGIGRAAIPEAIRSMLEQFSFGSAHPSFRYANARSERQNFGDGGTARGTAPLRHRHVAAAEAIPRSTASFRTTTDSPSHDFSTMNAACLPK